MQIYFSAMWRILLVLLLVLATIDGSDGSRALTILAALLVPVIFYPGALSRLWRYPVSSILGWTFAALLIAFSLAAEHPFDVRFILDFVFLLLIGPVFLVAASKASEKEIELVLWACLLGVVVALAVSLYDVVLMGDRRAHGYHTGALVLARHAILLGFLSTVGLFVVKDARRYLFLIGPVLGTIVILLAGARGVFVVLPALLLVFLAFFLTDRSQAYRFRIASAVALAGIATVIVPVLILDDSRLSQTFDVVGAVLTSTKTGQFSTDIRVTLMDIGWAAFRDAPFFGHGWNELPTLIAEQVSERDYNRIGFVQFHNDLVNFAVGAGIVGIVGYLAMLIAPLVGVWVSPRDKYFRARAYAIMCIVVGYAVCGLTDIVIGYDLPTISYGLFIAIFLGVVREKPKPI